MALFGNNKNGGYRDYKRTEPGYGGMGYSDHAHSDGRKPSIVGYAAHHNSKTEYVAQHEQRVEYRHVPAMTDHQYSPPRKETYNHGVGNKPLFVPPISGRDRPEKTDEFSPKARDEVVYGQSKNSPWNNSPPSRDQHYTTHDYGKHNNLNSKTNSKDDYDDDDSDDDDDDDVICNDGVCYKKGSRPNYLKEEDYNENEKHKRNVYGTLPTYTVPISTQPKRDPYNETSHINNNNNDQKEKGNSYGPRTFPFTTQPRSKDTSNNKPITTSAPQFNAPPKRDQGYHETIDSTEARRRYGKATTPGTAGYADQGKYSGTIDSKEAARKYNGVFLPN